MIAKSAGFMFVCIGLFLIGTALLVSGKIDQDAWVTFSQFVWGAQVAGGIGKVTADRWSDRANGGKNGKVA